ncbi:MAG TPA: hypothetical protein PLP86_01570 [Armatimonadota bacterium]|nr:hypothetical protein [Armatimonadota bacterium]
MNRGFRVASVVIGKIVIVLVVLAGFVSQPCLGASDVLFRFNIPDGTTWIETYKETNQKTIDGQVDSTSVIESKMRYQIKKTEDGYLVKRTPISFATPKIKEADYQEQVNYIAQEMRNRTPVEYVLNSYGACVGINGMEGLLEAITAEAYRQMPNLIELRVPPGFDQMISMVMQEEWNSKYRGLLGLRAKKGDTWSTTHAISSVVSDDTSAKLANNITWVDNVQKDGHNCAKLQYRTTVDPNVADVYLGQILNMESAVLDSTGKSHEACNVEYFERGEWIVDPVTMRFYSVIENQMIKWTDSIAGEGSLKCVVKVWKQCTYEYEAPKKTEPKTETKTENK